MARGLPDIPFDLPEVTPAAKRRAKRLADALEERYPDAACELIFSNAHELLIATMLSAQMTDAGVNKATPELFAAFPTPADYAASTPDEIEHYLRSINFFRNKAKAVHAAMTRVVEVYGGQVPDTMEDLLTLRGVARKTANVVLGNAFDKCMGFTVDTHVQRLAVRYGLVEDGLSVTMIERYLMALFPRPRWCKLSHQFVLHGRYACKARGGLCLEDSICLKFGSCARVAKAAQKKVAKKQTTKKKVAKKTSKKKTTAS